MGGRSAGLRSEHVDADKGMGWQPICEGGVEAPSLTKSSIIRCLARLAGKRVCEHPGRRNGPSRAIAKLVVAKEGGVAGSGIWWRPARLRLGHARPESATWSVNLSMGTT